MQRILLYITFTNKTKKFLEYLDITEEHFRNVIDRYRLPHIWQKENSKWKRTKIVSNNSLEGETPKVE